MPQQAQKHPNGKYALIFTTDRVYLQQLLLFLRARNYLYHNGGDNRQETVTQGASGTRFHKGNQDKFCT